jgi:formamidopyrimidine-DNA glycosylase
VHHRHVTGRLAPETFAAAVAGRRVGALWRRGKYLVFDLEGDPPLHLICHLRMTGRLRHVPRGGRWTEDARHTHATFRLEGGGRLIFHDVRKFGRLLLVPPEGLAAALPRGRDPVADGLEAADLARALRGRRGACKAVLLRQDVLCGLGNIYADEALHRAGLHPARPVAGLDAEETSRLAAAIRAVLEEALAFRGTTLWDYRTGDGDRGAFGRYLRVYGRGGLPCRACGAPIATLRLVGRTAAFCPRCQPQGAAAGPGGV